MRWVYLMCQRYKFKSKSQLISPSSQTSFRCIWCVKDTNLKANHNPVPSIGWNTLVYLMCQRYKFKSKSQQINAKKMELNGCIWCVKDTNLKANHNALFQRFHRQMVYLMCQRYKFKSKSQHSTRVIYLDNGCIWCVKDTNLKANHNEKQVEMITR